MLIAGAGGFARETLELLLQHPVEREIAFFDDVTDGVSKVYGKYKVLVSDQEAVQWFLQDPQFCLGIGGSRSRELFFNRFIALGGNAATVISPLAHFGKNEIYIAPGCTIATGTVITTNVKIGIGCLINLNCTIGHDSLIGDFCELSPGVHISGNCRIGNRCTIGTGAVLLPGVQVGDDAIVGAGAVVTKNVSSGLKVAGVPARTLPMK